MAYGIVKVDQITFTNGGADQTISVSGIVQSISGNITATGTIQGAAIIGTSTVSGATVTGNAGVFTTVTGGSAGFTTVTGTTVTGTTANFATLSGTTITGSVGNFGSGSAAAPSVSVGTTDNGIYSPGTDQVAISTNGVGRLSIDANGNVAVDTNTLYVDANNNRVGVGTTSPDVLFAVKSPGSSAETVTEFGNSLISNGLQILTNGNLDWGLNARNSRNLTFSTNQLERGRITSGGNVGIGTTSPDYLLDCQKTGSQLIRSRTNDTGSGASTGGFLGEYLGGGGGTNTQISIAAGNNYGFLSTLTNAALFIGTNSTEKLRIDTSGRVLIGTSSNSGGALLQVNDNRIRIATAKTPASATDTGTTGEICWDANYVYVCTATNTWKRSALSTW